MKTGHVPSQPAALPHQEVSINGPMLLGMSKYTEDLPRPLKSFSQNVDRKYTVVVRVIETLGLERVGGVFNQGLRVKMRRKWPNTIILMNEKVFSKPKPYYSFQDNRGKILWLLFSEIL